MEREAYPRTVAVTGPSFRLGYATAKTLVEGGARRALAARHRRGGTPQDCHFA